MTNQPSANVATRLSEIYTSLTPSDVARHIDGFYPSAIGNEIDVYTVYIVEVDWGRFNSGDLSSNPLQWWQYSGSTLVAIPYLDKSMFYSECDKGKKFWPHPIVSYFLEFPRVLLQESFGPRSRCWKIIHFTSPNLEIAKIEILSTWDG